MQVGGIPGLLQGIHRAYGLVQAELVAAPATRAAGLRHAFVSGDDLGAMSGTTHDQYATPAGGTPLVVQRYAADLMVGVKEGLGEQGADVPPAEPIHDALAVPSALDEPGEAQLGQVLARNGGTAARYSGEARHIQVGGPQSPEHPDPGGVGE